mmetsp:Transcript_7173/g.14157  ORF Transcript_7173/g.14157 Transcript_7173/m.14157 type:complete len:103 (+) Transcript_7173:110-418(+)|eukprot:scaffold15_cov204-Amphora_coffeaeformis.AAC.18
MGCQSSKLDHADDSIHVILAHANKHHALKQGAERGSAYVPRQPHPLLHRDQPATVTESDGDSQNELDRLLFHAAHHNDTIDPRDLEDYGTDDEEKDDEAQQP